MENKFFYDGRKSLYKIIQILEMMISSLNAEAILCKEYILKLAQVTSHGPKWIRIAD